MDAEINDSPSTLQQYLGFITTLKRFEPCHNLFTFPLFSTIAFRLPLRALVSHTFVFVYMLEFGYCILFVACLNDEKLL